MTNSSRSAELDATSPSAEEAYRLCRQIAHQHGANFSVGFRFLPRRKREAVYAAYAFCRRADDIADDPGTNQPQRLDGWQSELESAYSGRPHDPITIALADALQHFDIPKSAFIALIDGCRQDLVKARYQSFDELLQYCDYVASSISDVSLSIFGYREASAFADGRNLATALQLTNVSRDIGDDLQRDRIYVPMDELQRFGVHEGDLFARKETESIRNLIEFQIDRAGRYFNLAEPLLRKLDFDARFPTLLMGGVYAEVLRRLRADPFIVLRKRLSLTRQQKAAVILSRLVRPHFA